MAELLIELFSEEIPARMQKAAAEHLSNAVVGALKDAGLSVGDANHYCTPRRLALVVRDVPETTPDVREERRGPRVGAPEKALEGFCRGAGVSVDDLEVREEKKGEFYFAVKEIPGQPTARIIGKAVFDIITNFPWPKSQRWGNSKLRWVRPLHGVLCIFGGKVVSAAYDIEDGTYGYNLVWANPKKLIGCRNITHGHRFMAPEAIKVSSFDDYKKKLEAAKVLLDPADRMTAIGIGAQQLAADKGLELVEDRGLLAEVAGLVEWPVPLMGDFDPKFLAVPEEVLILTMKKDQKYFVTRDPATGKLAPHFITVSNMIASDGGAVIAAGNEKVIEARLADARFFWDQDLKGKLDDLLPNLDDIVFHKQLGTVAERVDRMVALAGDLADACGADRADAERAAKLAKADLTSHMVYEFPEVQGVMGRYYALEQGEKAEVADAVRDHYAPAGPSDDCPSAPVSIAVALAEKIDTLVGFFGIDQKPTGSKDPFALRRAALGVIRLITENDIRISLGDLFAGPARDDLLAFFADRLKVQQREKGVRHDLIDAVFALEGEDDLVRILNRVEALQALMGSEDGTNLLAGYKRAANILAKADDVETGEQSADLLAEDAEKALFDALSAAGDKVDAALHGEDFSAAMSVLASLRGPIDQFFEDVMVNADDAAVRANRLAMLAAFTGAVNRVADFSRIEG